MGFKDNLVKQKDGSYILKSKTKKAKKKGVCVECGENSQTRDLLYEYNAQDVVSVREYMEDHLISYPKHKKITPEWCVTCNALKSYKVSLHEKSN
tara:strand:- start:57 stop:341 length:285 start_codon:yes stop_codon:yes gene_type:complete